LIELFSLDEFVCYLKLKKKTYSDHVDYKTFFDKKPSYYLILMFYFQVLFQVERLFAHFIGRWWNLHVIIVGMTATFLLAMSYSSPGFWKKEEIDNGSVISVKLDVKRNKLNVPRRIHNTQYDYTLTRALLRRLVYITIQLSYNVKSIIEYNPHLPFLSRKSHFPLLLFS